MPRCRPGYTYSYTQGQELSDKPPTDGDTRRWWRDDLHYSTWDVAIDNGRDADADNYVRAAAAAVTMVTTSSAYIVTYVELLQFQV